MPNHFKITSILLEINYNLVGSYLSKNISLTSRFKSETIWPLKTVIYTIWDMSHLNFAHMRNGRKKKVLCQLS